MIVLQFFAVEFFLLDMYECIHIFSYIYIYILFTFRHTLTYTLRNTLRYTLRVAGFGVTETWPWPSNPSFEGESD